MKHLPLLVIIFTLLFSSVTGCSEKPRVKNVILMIGDGMGPQQVALLDLFARYSKYSEFDEDELTAFHRFAEEGTLTMSRVEPEGKLVVDSACSATQLATGHKTVNEIIGGDADGNSVSTILEKARDAGYSTGLVSDTRLTHATPASFAAHVPHRSDENTIAEHLISSGADVLFSGGLRHFLPADTGKAGHYRERIPAQVEIKSKRNDNKDLILQAIRDKYNVVFDREQMATASEEKVLGLFSSSGMADGITYFQNKNSDKRVEPSLAEMTRKALDLLARKEKGFFLMVEGGQIDWAAHDNDAGTMLKEMLKFEEAVRAVYEWAAGREDTVVVITADHETGSFGFSYSYYDAPEKKSLPGNLFKDTAFQPSFNFGEYELLDRLYEQKMSCQNILNRAGDSEDAGLYRKLVNENYPYKISAREASDLVSELNIPEYRAGHRYLSRKSHPDIGDLRHFYPYGKETRCGILARKLAAKSGVVWGTGTHTTTPVPLFVWGPESAQKKFTPLMHSSDVGRQLQRLLGL